MAYMYPAATTQMTTKKIVRDGSNAPFAADRIYIQGKADRWRVQWNGATYWKGDFIRLSIIRLRFDFSTTVVNRVAGESKRKFCWTQIFR
jgi:hypothetical protein